MQEPEVVLTGTSKFRKENEPGISWLVIILLLALLAVAVMVFDKHDDPIAGATPTPAEESPTPSMAARVYTVSYDAGVFSPTNLRIHAGDTVRFKNESIFPIHVVSDDIVGFDSVGDVPQGSYFAFTFAARGTFSYYNKHNKDQTGSIIVR
jgi:plastocyanin